MLRAIRVLLIVGLLNASVASISAQRTQVVEWVPVTIEEVTARIESDAADHAARATAHPRDAFSPSGPWPGPIVVPDIVRPELLPMRMYNDPALPKPELLWLLDDRLVGLCERALREGTDAEVREVAVVQLLRIAQARHADISSTFDTLKVVMADPDSPRLSRVCALALAEANAPNCAAELVRLAETGETPDRLILESALARWKAPEAAALWRNRLPGTLETSAAVRLACEGLAALGDQQALAVLTEALRTSSLGFPKRLAAACALCQLDGHAAVDEALKLIPGSVSDRLLAVALLNQPSPAAHAQTEILCDDAEDGVASAAWQQLFEQNPDSLLSHLSAGHAHRDAVIRMTAARVMRLHPDAERLAWLQMLMSDSHITVRNVARTMLELVAREQPELREPIVQQAAEVLKPDSKDWQGLEQSLVLLGQLRAMDYSSRCMPLLDYPRQEVMVASAWLIHLYPDEAIRAAVLEQVAKQEARLANQTFVPGDPEKQAMLFQYCGLLRVPNLMPLYEQQFSKGAPGGAHKRAAAIWAIGLLHERNPVPELVQQLEGRIKDRPTEPPEEYAVRRMSVIALGLMRASAAVPTVEEAYRIDSPNTMIPATAQWVMPLIGQPMPPNRDREKRNYSGWRLTPAGDAIP